MQETIFTEHNFAAAVTCVTSLCAASRTETNEIEGDVRSKLIRSHQMTEERLQMDLTRDTT